MSSILKNIICLALFSAASVQAANPWRPAAPSNLSAAAISSSQINLTWQDNSGNETGFIIKRAASAAGPWTQIATVGPAASSYANTGLSAGTTWYYLVCAYNSRGFSADAGPASATTLAASCAYSLSSSSASFTASGGNGSVNISTTTGCAWTVSGLPDWIATLSSGTGPGTVNYLVAANTATTSRSASLIIAGSSFTVSQDAAPCSFSVSPSTAAFPSTGGNGSVSVTTGAGCGWSIESAPSWITIGTGGNGPATIGYSIAANTNSSSRFATLTIAGQTFSVSQTAQVADTTPPSVSLNTPGSGGTVSATISLSASAADNVGVTKVEFYCDGGMLAGTATTAPYNVSCDTTKLANGNHSFYAKAYDAAGNATPSVASTVNVSNVIAGQTQWVKTMLSRTNGDVAEGWSVTTDAAGNVIVAGDFNHTVDFGGATISSYAWGNYDGFVAKYSPQGSLLWSNTFGGFGTECAKAVAADSQGNVIVAGSFSATASFGGVSLTAPDPYLAGASDMFVAKYATNGALVWVKQFGGNWPDYASAVAVDSKDNIILAGRFQSPDASFGDTTLSAGADSFAFALVKLSPAGTPLWAKRLGGTIDTEPQGLAVDSAGDIVASGRFRGSTDLGGGAISPPGAGVTIYSTFVAKYSGVDGSYRWAKGFGASSVDGGCGITTDPVTGNVIVTGGFLNAADFGGGSVSSPGEAVFLAGYDPAGNFLWVKTYGGDSGTTDWGTAVKMDGKGNLVLTGSKGNPWNVGGAWNFGTGSFVMSYSVSGNTAPAVRWIKLPGPTSNAGSVGNGVTLDPQGRVLATGSFGWGAADFGGLTASSPSSTSGFTVEYSN